MSSILVYVPTHDDAMMPETLESVHDQDTSDYDVQIGLHNPDPRNDKRINLLAQQRRARTMTLDGGYDALVFVEHDMRIPTHAIRALYETDAPIAYGVYMLRHKSYKLNALQYVNERNLGESLGQHPKELRQAERAQQWKVSGIGFGCTLIRREVLRDLDFHRGPRDREPYADRQFATDALHAGYNQIARFDVKCDHWCPHDDMWLEIGKSMADNTVKVTALQDVVVSVNGASTAMVKGEEYEVPQSQVSDWVRAGFVSAAMPKPKATTKPARKATARKRS